MSGTSRKIIAAIRTKSGHFTKKDLINEVVDSRAERPGKKRGKRAKPLNAEKKISIIEETLDDIVAAGLVKHKKNQYIRIHSFVLEGNIRLNTSGNGVVPFGEYEIIIRDEDTAGARHNDLVSVAITDLRKGICYGVVQKILQRSRETYFAKVVHVTRELVIYNLIDTPGSREVCSPKADKDAPVIDDIVLVKLEENKIRDRQRCALLHVYSPDDDSYDLDRVVLKHSLPPPHRDYQELVNAKDLCRDKSPRKDYTGTFTVTIDGEKAKDFDDAVSIVKDSKGYLLSVHIADVSAYVLKDTELDREALARGTSYYLGNSVIPMLPEILSNDLCSLREGLDRHTMSVEMRFDRNGAMYEHSFHRGVIRVRKRLTYTIVDEILSSKQKSPLHDILSTMYELTALLHKKRIAEGSLELNLTDESLIYENNVVTDIQYIERLKSHQIIEEFMLCANVVVSRALREAKRPSLFRNHEVISTDSLISLKNFFKQINIHFKTTGNAAFNIQKVLKEISGTRFEYVVNMVILRSFMQAYYGASPEGHFGLGFRDYTHFTSPIRRYPDLVVHRCLKSFIDGTRPPYTLDELIFIGDKSSEMERVGQSAERDFVKLKACRLMMHRVGELFEALVSGVSRFGFFVKLIEQPIDGMVPLRALTDDYYLVKEDDYTIIGKRYGRRFRIGDKVRVKLTNVELERMIMDFDIA